MSLFQNEIFSDKVFYHVYPLGLSNAPEYNNFSQPAARVFETMTTDLDRIRNLGCNALYIGPVFESTKHGYDTIDYYHIDRRLGNNQTFKEYCIQAHQKGFSVILDAVFNHTGRNFFAFQDLIRNGYASQYRDWYVNLHFDRKSPYGDPFDYDGWAGCKDLVKLNLNNEDVKNHIFSAVKFWIEEFQIDGLRLDAADVMDKKFLHHLASFCRSIKKDFWLMGEVVHGDYNQWANSNCLDSVTNYQIYNSIWGSVNQQNFFDLSFNLNREFNSQQGLYRYAPLYNFLDNHDVNRLASVLKNPREQLKLVYGLLYTIPGIPSIYYGSENGIKGVRTNNSDYQLRPSLPPFSTVPDYAQPEFNTESLPSSISTFSQIRANSKALQKGDYQEVLTTNKQFAFTRTQENQKVLVLANCDQNPVTMNLSRLNLNPDAQCKDLTTMENLSARTLNNITVSPYEMKIIQIQ